MPHVLSPDRPRSAQCRLVTPVLNATVLLALEVSDAEVVAELKKHSEGAPRQAFALGALRLGVLSLRQAAGELDATAIREAGQKLLSSLAELLAQRGTEITTDLSAPSGSISIRQPAHFPSASKLSSAMMVSSIGLSGTHLAPENSTIARALATHLGEGSQLFKLLSPTDASGLKAQISAMLESVLEEQQGQILKEFSLDNKESALSRLITELATNNGELKTDLKTQVDGLVGEFSLDKPDSALSRLVAKVEAAQKAITDEFSTDNEQSAITRLSRMLQDTRQQIDKNLTLDDDTSALSRLKRELHTTIESAGEEQHATSSPKSGPRLASMQARKRGGGEVDATRPHLRRPTWPRPRRRGAAIQRSPCSHRNYHRRDQELQDRAISSRNSVRTAPPLARGSFGKRRTTKATT